LPEGSMTEIDNAVLVQLLMILDAAEQYARPKAGTSPASLRANLITLLDEFFSATVEPNGPQTAL